MNRLNKIQKLKNFKTRVEWYFRVLTASSLMLILSIAGHGYPKEVFDLYFKARHEDLQRRLDEDI